MLSWTLALCLFAADEVELVDGTVIEGKVKDLGDSIQITRGGASITYPKSAIKRIEFKKTREEVYEEKAKELKDSDLEGHRKLAQWCVEQKLRDPAKAEFRKVLALDPDHEEARAALGHKRYNGQWLTDDEIKQAQGFVKHKGKWITPEERDLDVALDTQKEMDRKIASEVKKWLDKMASSKEEARAEARARLGEIGDGYKAKPYLAALTASSPSLRLFVVEELGRMKEPAAAKPLARRVIWDAKEEVRAAALKSLLAVGHPETALYLIPHLDEDSSAARLRVEEALSFFPDLRSVPPLLRILSVLQETLNFIEKYENQMAQLIRRTLLLKNGRKIVVPAHLKIDLDVFAPESKARLRAEKDACVTALRAITGQDFAEDTRKWAEWYEKNKK